MNVVIIPLAAIEYHGILPIETDYLVASCVSERLKRRLRGKGVDTATVLPPLPYTSSIEHSGAGPTITGTPNTILKLLVELALSAHSTGAAGRAIVYIAFHGGVAPLAYMAARQAMYETRGQLLATSLSFYTHIERILGEKYGVKTRIIHADPVEASILLACGHRKGIREAPEEEVLREEAALQSKYRETLTPWMHWDIKYPSSPVPASSSLGETLIEEFLKETIPLVKKLSSTITVI